MNPAPESAYDNAVIGDSESDKGSKSSAFSVLVCTKGSIIPMSGSWWNIRALQKQYCSNYSSPLML